MVGTAAGDEITDAIHREQASAKRAELSAFSGAHAIAQMGQRNNGPTLFAGAKASAQGSVQQDPDAVKEAKASRADRWSISGPGTWEQKYVNGFSGDGSWQHGYQNNAASILDNNIYTRLDHFIHSPNPIFQIEKPIEPVAPELWVLAGYDLARLGMSAAEYAPAAGRGLYAIWENPALLGKVPAYAMDVARDMKGTMVSVAASAKQGILALSEDVGNGVQWAKSRLGLFGRDGGESAWMAAEKAMQSMDPSQVKNLSRFIDKLPKNSENIRVKNFLNGGKVFQADSPATNIPGSFARYEKQIDAAGNTVLYTKTTYGPNGEIIHVAPKFPAGP